MPQIKEYRSQVQSAGPIGGRQATAEDFGAGKYAAMDYAGQQAAGLVDAVYKRQEQAETSEAHAEAATIHAEETARLRDNLKKAKPGEDFTGEFMQKFQERMDKAGEKFSTNGAKNYFTNAKSELTKHFMETAMSGQAEVAGAFAKQNFVKAQSANSAGLLENPTGLAAANKLNEDFLAEEVKNGRMSEVTAGELRGLAQKENAVSAVKGWIRTKDGGPEAAIAMLKKGAFDDSGLDAKEKDALLGEAEATIRARKSDNEMLRIQEERAKKQRQNDQGLQALRDMKDGKLTAEKILTDPAFKDLDAFGEGSRNTIMGVLQRYNEQGGAFQSDPARKNELFLRINGMGNGPRITTSNEVMAYVGKGIDANDAVWLSKQIEEAQKPGTPLEAQVLKSAHVKLAKPDQFNRTDPNGETNYRAYMEYFDEQKAARVKEGKPLDKAWRDDMEAAIINFEKTSTQKFREGRDRETVVKLKRKPGGMTVQDIDTLNKGQLDQLDVRGLTPEQKDAAARRYDLLYTESLKPKKGR